MLGHSGSVVPILPLQCIGVGKSQLHPQQQQLLETLYSPPHYNATDGAGEGGDQGEGDDGEGGDGDGDTQGLGSISLKALMSAGRESEPVATPVMTGQAALTGAPWAADAAAREASGSAGSAGGPLRRVRVDRTASEGLPATFKVAGSPGATRGGLGIGGGGLSVGGWIESDPATPHPGLSAHTSHHHSYINPRHSQQMRSERSVSVWGGSRPIAGKSDIM